MHKIIIIQARMGASRLPGKPLKKILGQSILSYQIDRLRLCKNCDDIIVATTTNSLDDPIVKLCLKENIKFYRGSELDVLDRYFKAAKEFKGDVIVRITADCPLIDPFLVDSLIDYYMKHKESCDYVSNTLERTFPRGLDCEVFSFKALEIAATQGDSPSDREHVTPYIYEHPKIFKIKGIKALKNLKFHRWTLDTAEDLTLITKIIEALYPVNPNFTTEDILHCFEKHPEWLGINSHVAQKSSVIRVRR